MPHVLASARVEDFEQFLSIFTTKGVEVRKEHGSRGTRLFRNSDDPNTVTIVFDFDHDAFRQFIASPEGQSVMQEAGIQGKPDILFLDHVMDTEG